MATLTILTDLEPFLAVPTLTPLVGINVLGSYESIKKYVSQIKWPDGACHLTCYPFVPDAVRF
jgi:biotin-(acetyl-CoA carboxylase) ligase